ncbi:U-box domain-containing protein 9-like [Rhododendron vialii]|uniref:U-box domain-containing protein 9-like n=1 Tax=Rhododendron vialii TaxID=182163 RepID=UPI00265E7818|nr:U-box domain-containing protein 9-like [Rhododendron vialii]
MSGEIMGDPVVVASGQESYSWFNWLLKIANGIKGFIDAATIASPDRGYLDSLLDNMMSSSLSDQKSSAETLRWLTDEYPPYRDLLGNNDEALSKLLQPLAVPRNACLDLHLQGDIITTVLNISLPEGNKKVVAENPRVIPLLIDCLRTGTTMTKRNTAAALSKLSEFHSNRTLIVESGALGPLIRLVGEGNPETMANGLWLCSNVHALPRSNHRYVWRKSCQRLRSEGGFEEVMDGAFLDLLPRSSLFLLQEVR